MADHECDLRSKGSRQAFAIAAISAITLGAIAACAGSSRDGVPVSERENRRFIAGGEKGVRLFRIQD